MITDIKNIWFVFAEEKQIEEEKNKYNKSILTENSDDILKLLSKYISNYDPSSIYSFKEVL